MSAEQKKRSYVEIMRDELHEYSQRLVVENDQLRTTAAGLLRDRQRLESELEEVRHQNAGLRSSNESFIHSHIEMMSATALAKKERAGAVAELLRLRRAFDTIALQNGIYAELYEQVRMELVRSAGQPSTPDAPGLWEELESEPANDEPPPFVTVEPGGELDDPE